MTEHIVTYRSENAEKGWEWIAFVFHERGRLNILFHGTTEAEAEKNAAEFWEKDRAKREASIERREEARRKAAETKRLKKEAAEA